MDIGLIATLVWGLMLIGLVIAGVFFIGFLIGGDIKEALVCIACLLPIVVVIYMGTQLETEQVKTYSYNIYALEDGSTLKGSRYYIEQNSKYFYLADYKDGQKRYSVNCSEAYVVENASDKPHIDVIESRYINPNMIEKFFYGTFDEGTEYKIVVPKKTLTTDFNVDLQN